MIERTQRVKDWVSKNTPSFPLRTSAGRRYGDRVLTGRHLPHRPVRHQPDVAVAGVDGHDPHESLPFIVLDPREALDSDWTALLVEYFGEHAEYRVIGLPL
jgi:hypothetical protein